MTISQVTPYTGIAPARVGQTQTEFSNNGDDMNAYFAVIADSMNLSIDGINLAVIDINANTIIASDSADTASAAANFKGEWSDLTGALNIPASVFHDDSYWQLINNLADVTLSEPTALSADWKVSYSELNGIARGLNKANEAVKYGRTGEILGVEVENIYNPDEEVTWELPALTQPDEVIVSVTLDELVTDIDTYVLIAVTPITKISDSIIGTSTSTAASELSVSTLKTNTVETTAEVIAEGQDWAGVAYVDPDAIGANPTAKIYPDGSIVGSTDNGSYTKSPNGNLVCRNIVDGGITSTVMGAVFRSSGVAAIFPILFVSTPTTAISANYASGLTFAWAGESGLATVSGASLLLFAASNDVGANITYIANGRWK